MAFALMSLRTNVTPEGQRAPKQTGENLQVVGPSFQLYVGLCRHAIKQTRPRFRPASQRRLMLVSASSRIVQESQGKQLHCRCRVRFRENTLAV